MDEPTRTSLLVDSDGDVWRHVDGAWVCLTQAGDGLWEDLQAFGPFQVFTPQTDDGAVQPGHGLGGSTSEAAVPSSTTDEAVRPGPVPIGGQPGAASSLPRSFQLIRHRDVSDVSGTGLVAEGTQFRDGAAALRWYGEHPSTVAWPSVEDIVAVHGHEGATEVRWLDEHRLDGGDHD